MSGIDKAALKAPYAGGSDAGVDDHAVLDGTIGRIAAGTPDEDRMVVTASTETKPAARGKIFESSLENSVRTCAGSSSCGFGVGGSCVDGNTECRSSASPIAACSSTSIIMDEQDLLTRSARTSSQFLQDIMCCSFCRKELQYGKHKPYILSACLHTVCQLCAERYNSAAVVECNQCGLPSPSLLDHHLVLSLLSRHRSTQSDRVCGQCHERGAQAIASSICCECDVHLCADCDQAHRRTRATWSHCIRPFDVQSQESRCSAHGKLIDNYCDTCLTLCCSECILSDHRSHQSCTIDTKAGRLSADLNTKVQFIKNMQSQTEQLKRSLRQNLESLVREKTNSVEYITEHYKSFQEKVRVFFQKQRDLAERCYLPLYQQLSTRLNEVTALEGRMSHMNNFISQLIELGDSSVIVRTNEMVLSGFEKLQSSSEFTVPSITVPHIEMRRVFGFDQIDDMMSLLLYDGNRCVQPDLKNTLANAFLKLTMNVMRNAIHSGSQSSHACIAMIMDALQTIPNVSPDLCLAVEKLSVNLRKRCSSESMMTTSSSSVISEGFVPGGNTHPCQLYVPATSMGSSTNFVSSPLLAQSLLTNGVTWCHSLTKPTGQHVFSNPSLDRNPAVAPLLNSSVPSHLQHGPLRNVNPCSFAQNRSGSMANACLSNAPSQSTDYIPSSYCLKTPVLPNNSPPVRNLNALRYPMPFQYSQKAITTPVRVKNAQYCFSESGCRQSLLPTSVLPRVDFYAGNQVPVSYPLPNINTPKSVTVSDSMTPSTVGSISSSNIVDRSANMNLRKLIRSESVGRAFSWHSPHEQQSKSDTCIDLPRKFRIRVGAKRMLDDHELENESISCVVQSETREMSIAPSVPVASIGLPDNSNFNVPFEDSISSLNHVKPNAEATLLSTFNETSKSVVSGCELLEDLDEMLKKLDSVSPNESLNTLNKSFLKQKQGSLGNEQLGEVFLPVASAREISHDSSPQQTEDLHKATSKVQEDIVANSSHTDEQTNVSMGLTVDDVSAEFDNDLRTPSICTPSTFISSSCARVVAADSSPDTGTLNDLVKGSITADGSSKSHCEERDCQRNSSKSTDSDSIAESSMSVIASTSMWTISVDTSFLSEQCKISTPRRNSSDVTKQKSVDKPRKRWRSCDSSNNSAKSVPQVNASSTKHLGGIGSIRNLISPTYKSKTCSVVPSRKCVFNQSSTGDRFPSKSKIRGHKRRRSFLTTFRSKKAALQSISDNSNSSLCSTHTVQNIDDNANSAVPPDTVPQRRFQLNRPRLNQRMPRLTPRPKPPVAAPLRRASCPPLMPLPSAIQKSVDSNDNVCKKKLLDQIILENCSPDEMRLMNNHQEEPGHIGNRNIGLNIDLSLPNSAGDNEASESTHGKEDIGNSSNVDGQSHQGVAAGGDDDSRGVYPAAFMDLNKSCVPVMKVSGNNEPACSVPILDDATTCGVSRLSTPLEQIKEGDSCPKSNQDLQLEEGDSVLKECIPPAAQHLVQLPPGGLAALEWDPVGDPLCIGVHQSLLYQPPCRRPSSPNLSYCVLCWDGGDIVLCDVCERAYHRNCYLGSIDDNCTWQCLMCTEMKPPREPELAARQSSMNQYEVLLAKRLLMELYCSYYSSLYVKNMENLSKVAEFAHLPNAISLECIREGLLNHEFSSLMHFLKALRSMLDQSKFMNKNTAPHRFLRELDEVFDAFVREKMSRYWFLLDDQH